MSFNIVVQTNSSEKNRLDKSITDLATLTGTLRTDTSIIDPVFRIEGNLASYITANYCTVEAFGRSYFINNIRSIRNGLFEISCHVDVLTSFKTQIRANKAILQKSENNWNLYLNDGSLQTEHRPEIITSKFSNGDALSGTWSYVLIVAG